MATLQVTKRAKPGKYDAFNLRKAGRVPAVVYGRGEENVAVSMALKDFQGLLKRGERMVDLAVDGAAPKKAVLKAVQHGTYDSELLHADFRLVHENEVLQIDVSIELRGEAPGTREGGMLEHETPMIAVRCLPKDIPAVISVDVSAMNVGDIVYADGLPELPGVAYVYHGRPAIVTCRLPQRAAESAEAGEGGPTQPEVMAEKASEARQADKK